MKPLATIPALLHVDVEPDAFQVAARDAHAWAGCRAAIEFAQSLRTALERASGDRPRFSWYVRTDPQVAHVCGRADDAFRVFAREFAALRGEGDAFGVHAHPIRWSAERSAWVHDVADPAWLRECTTSSLDAFARATGAPARIYRAGAGLLHESIVDVLDAAGVDLDLTLEPARTWAHEATDVETAVDGSPIVGTYTDCSAAPRTPYRPARGDFRRPGGADARRITLIPVTTAPRKMPPTGIASLARRLIGRPARPRSPRVMYPSAPWPSARAFWDLVAFQLSTMARPYVSLAVRTDAPGSELATRVTRLFQALPQHPIAQRLRFVTPPEAVATLLPAATSSNNANTANTASATAR